MSGPSHALPGDSSESRFNALDRDDDLHRIALAAPGGGRESSAGANVRALEDRTHDACPALDDARAGRGPGADGGPRAELAELPGNGGTGRGRRSGPADDLG